MNPTANSEGLGKTWDLSPVELLRLFQQISHLVADKRDATAMLRGACEHLGNLLPIDRCIFSLTNTDNEQLAPGEAQLSITAEYCASPHTQLGAKHYQLNSNSETWWLMVQGKPLPLKDIMSGSSSANASNALDRFVAETESKAVVAFPMVAVGQLVGMMSFHHCTEAKPFPEHILALGEALAEELASAVERTREIAEKELESQIFREIGTPALILDRGSGRIKRANTAACKELAGTRKELQGLPLAQVIPDSQKLINASRELSSEQPVVSFGSVMVGTSDGKPVHMDACLSLMDQSSDDLLIMLMPLRNKSDADGEAGKATKNDELSNTLTRQLSWERWVRQIICKTHATLDRDTLLQTVVDGFGRALGASRCLIVRTDGPATPMVTHEYVEPDISPLGLGRTGQFPSAVVSFFKHKVGAVADINTLERSGELSAEEFEYFADNGIRSMAGAPITSHGITYGVIIILESRAGRKWAPHELDMLEIAAAQTAVALAHSQSYQQLKDQLFNMNLLGNLTQQLTNTLELVSRSGKAESAEDKARQAGSSPPLSLRELEVLKLIAAGLANREIAQRLFLTESTVELHASRIRKKLKLKSRTALVKYACDNGLA